MPLVTLQNNWLAEIDPKSLPSPDNIKVDSSLPLHTYEHVNGNYYAHPETIHFIRQALEKAAANKPTTRAVILDEAKKLTTSDRNSSYGEPIDHLSHVASILNAYGYRGPGGRELHPHDVPIFQIVVKLSRLSTDPTKMDSWVDTSGYAAIGGEVAEIVFKDKKNA